MQIHVTPKLTERFWSKVSQAGPNQCWLWEASTFPTGYGQFWVKEYNRLLGAHRVAYTLANGPIPDELLVCHTCDNPPCVNPAHLFLSDSKGNTQDMIAKGRQNNTRSRHNNYARGESHYRAKLTRLEVQTIRQHYQKGQRGYGICALAKQYNVYPNTIYSIVHNLTWKEVKK